jgi:hypothetical protein
MDQKRDSKKFRAFSASKNFRRSLNYPWLGKLLLFYPDWLKS